MKLTILRIFNFLAFWLEIYFDRDFQGNDSFLTLKNFLQELQVNDFLEWHLRIELIIMRKCLLCNPKGPLFSTFYLQENKNKKSKRLSSKLKQTHKETPKSSVISLDIMNPIDVAEQLTLREWELFRLIPESEFLNKVWLRDPNDKKSHINTVINNFNQISLWIVSEIVSKQDLRERVAHLKKILFIAELLFELGNYNALMEFIAALSMTAVQRLQKTWDLIGPSKAVFEKFSNIMTTNQNFQSYRYALSSKKLPLVPYLGVILKDVIFIEEGNQEKLSDGLLNFDRIQLFGKLITEVKRYQKVAYDIPVINSIQDYFFNLNVALNADELYETSLLIEEIEII